MPGTIHERTCLAPFDQKGARLRRAGAALDLPDEDVQALVDGGLEAFTETTVLTKSGLDEKFRQMKDSSIVWTLQEFSDDVTGVAAMIRTATGDPVAALNVYGPDYRFPGDRSAAEVAAVLLDACTRIGDRLA